MELKQYTSDVKRQLVLCAAAVDVDTQQVVDRLVAGLQPALRLALLDALGVAAGEISRELAPGSVELRLRGGEPEFVVTVPPPEIDATAIRHESVGPPEDTETGEVVRINLRLPEGVKSRVEAAASRDGVSINSWLVRAAVAAVERADPATPRSAVRIARGGQRYTGWAR